MGFTSWCWNVLGISFAVSGFITLYVEENQKHYSFDEISRFPQMKLLLRSSLLLFEIAGPLSMLVSFVVTNVLWPQALRGGSETKSFKRIPILIQHNANSIMSLVELGFLGVLPVRFTDLALAPIFGVIYVFFSWSMRFYWVPSGEPQFLYFFLDTTLGKTSTIALVILVGILVVSYAVFVFIDDIILHFGGGPEVSVGVIAVILILLCRFTD